MNNNNSGNNSFVCNGRTDVMMETNDYSNTHDETETLQVFPSAVAVGGSAETLFCCYYY